jgi:nicotinamide mononucleotide transporter
MAFASAALLASYWWGVWQVSFSEVLGFITGGLCVWLTVRESVWNWPLGLANTIFFFVLFFWSGLYADMGLQVLYFVLGIWGWVNWLHGGAGGTTLRVTRTAAWEWITLAVFLIAGTFGLRALLVAVNGSAPWLDALTTGLSLSAQYLLCRKRFEHWFFWIAADVVYIPLYVWRGLHLTALLYAVFLAMCFLGVRAWRRSLTSVSPTLASVEDKMATTQL